MGRHTCGEDNGPYQLIYDELGCFSRFYLVVGECGNFGLIFKNPWAYFKVFIFNSNSLHL